MPSTALLVPLVYRGQSLGVLAAFDRLEGDGAFTRDDEQLLEAFAAQAATAVATASRSRPIGAAARWRPPKPSATAGRASCTTRRCRRSAA